MNAMQPRHAILAFPTCLERTTSHMHFKTSLSSCALGLQFVELKADFQHNIGLLAERDAELTRSDTSIVELTDAVNSRTRELALAHADLAHAKEGECVQC